MPKFYEISSRCLLNLGHRAINWFRYYVVFSWAAILISSLVFSYGFVEFAVNNVLISYLTTDLKMEYLPKAAMIIYIQDGVSSVLTIVLIHISDAYTGRFEMVAISTAFYILMSSRCLLNLGHGVINWFRYYVAFSWAAIFISGLVFSHGFVEYALSNVLISYLAINLKMEYLPKAATIIYIQDGVSSVLTIVLAHISDAYTGRFEMVAISTAFYILGLLLMRLFGTQKMLFYVAMALVAVGSAGREPILKAFLADQLRELEPKPSIDEERVEARTSVWWRVARFSGATTATFAILSDTEWEVKFHASLLAMVVAYLMLWLGFSLYYCNWMGFSLEYCNWWAFSLYYCKKATGSPLTLVVRVLKAAIMKCHLDYPLESTQFYRNDSNQLPLFPRIRFLRLLDKAAIVEKSSLSPEEQEIKRRVFTVAQVKEVKLLFRTAPMWIPFYVYSLVAATGNTFFIDQAANLNDIIGDGFVVPMNIFFLMRSFLSFTVPYLWDLLISKHLGEGGKHRAMLVRIGCGMVCLILCCITAWQVELRRLHYSTGEMSIFWLTPQYCLLGVMEGLALEGLQVFFNGQVAESMRSYGPPFAECVLGIGNFLSVPFIFIFRDTLNTNHLDHYYHTLVLLSVGNLLIYIFVPGIYYYKHPAEEENSAPNMEEVVTEAQAEQPST